MSACRIYLSGAHSTGKTTILKDLKDHLNVRFEEEIARNVIKRLNWNRDEFLPDKCPEKFFRLNEEILRQQILIDETHFKSDSDFIADRCIDPIIYVQRYIGNTAKEKLFKMTGLKEWFDRLKTALIFVIQPHKECIVDDSIRFPPHFHDLTEFHNAIMTEYQELNIPVYEIVELDRHARHKFIMDKIMRSYPQVIYGA